MSGRSLALLCLSLLAGFGLYQILSPREFVMPENLPSFEPVAGAAEPKPDADKLEVATIGGGCFWCTEAIFLQLKGVKKVVSGYSGGTVKNPTYEQVCTGVTGHAEVIQVTFDPNLVNYADILEVFWKTHDPTTLNRQGADVGTQYRSVIYYHSAKQKELAEAYKKKIDEAKVFPKPIVTEISPAVEFYAAENYHQNYFALNKRQPYCQAIIQPKIDKLQKVFKDKLK